VKRNIEDQLHEAGDKYDYPDKCSQHESLLTVSGLPAMRESELLRLPPKPTSPVVRYASLRAIIGSTFVARQAGM
jgi:hypothetical protein